MSIGGVLKGTYSYNAAGERTRKLVTVTGGNREDHFVFDRDGKLIAERVCNVSGTSTWVEYLYLEDMLIAQNLRSLIAAGAMTSERLIYLHGDQLDTPRLATDATQRVVWRRDGDPFGNSGLNQNPDGDGISEVVNLRFPGQYFDAEADVEYNYFRDYDRVTGRYTQGDPIGLGLSFNRFGYVNAAALIKTDALGLGTIINNSNFEIPYKPEKSDVQRMLKPGGSAEVDAIYSPNEAKEKTAIKIPDTTSGRITSTGKLELDGGLVGLLDKHFKLPYKDGRGIPKPLAPEDLADGGPEESFPDPYRGRNWNCPLWPLPQRE